MTVALLILLALAARVMFLYFAPFGLCPRCHGQRRIMRGTKNGRRPVTCPKCKGVGRRQRPGSRTIHQLARRIRREVNRTRTERTITDATRNL